jgi:hypothetical protein
VVNPLVAIALTLAMTAPPAAATTPLRPTTTAASGESSGDDRSTFSSEGWQQPPWDFVVLPIVGANVDEGLGGGVLFAAHRYTGNEGFFRDDFALRIFLTSRFVQRHELKWEGIDVADLPLRVLARVGYYSTVTQNYCGTGNAVRCDDDRAAAAAREAGLIAGSEAFDEFVRHYHRVRFIRPHADLLLRWALTEAPTKIEFMGGARVAYYIPGDFTSSTPYPGSLYAEAFPQGEPGLSSVLQLGLTIDRRDVEASPTRGYFVETSLRAATPAWGSTWTWAGANAAAAFYVPMPFSTTLASRTMADLIIGDAPTEEQATIGGTRDHTAFGGQWIGRGLREHRGIGKVKLIQQFELRRELFDFVVFGVRIDVGAGTFTDVGWIGADLFDFGGGAVVDGVLTDIGSPTRLLFGTGGGLRILLNRALLMRLDLAWSPFEAITPSFYTPFGYPF